MREGEKGGGVGNGGWGMGKSQWLVPAVRPSKKTEEAVNHRQNNYVKAMGTSPLGSN